MFGNQMEVHRLFSVPILHFKLSTHNEYVFNYPKVGELKNNKPMSWVGAVNTTFPKAKGDNIVSKEQLERLKSDIVKEIEVAFLHLNLTSKFTIDDFWYNIYEKGFGQEAHDHLSYNPVTDSLWSGVYYHKNCSSIPTVFLRPDSKFRCQLFDGCGYSQIGDAFLGNWSPQVSDGDIILFPPYLQHYVFCDIDDVETRMTFSFNIDRTTEDICREAWDRDFSRRWNSGQGGTQPPETLS